MRTQVGARTIGEIIIWSGFTAEVAYVSLAGLLAMPPLSATPAVAGWGRGVTMQTDYRPSAVPPPSPSCSGSLAAAFAKVACGSSSDMSSFALRTLRLDVYLIIQNVRALGTNDELARNLQQTGRPRLSESSEPPERISRVSRSDSALSDDR